MMKFETHSEAETLRFAARLAEKLRAGDVVLLHGDLGAGKSVFARGVGRALGVVGAMPSPTFTLLIPHEAAGARLYHFDLYRLNDPEEFYAAGLDEFIGGDGIALIEWPEMAELEEATLELYLRRGATQDAREIEMVGSRAAECAPVLAEWRREE